MALCSKQVAQVLDQLCFFSISGGGNATTYKGKLFQSLINLILKSFLHYLKSELPMFQLLSPYPVTAAL